MPDVASWIRSQSSVCHAAGVLFHALISAISIKVLAGVAGAVQNADDEDDGILVRGVAVEHSVWESPHSGPSQAGEPVDGRCAVPKGSDARDRGVNRVGEVFAQCGIDPRVVVTSAAQIVNGVLAEDDRHSFGHSSRRTSSHSRCALGRWSNLSRPSTSACRSASDGT